jgi:hypothetical protein
MKSSIVSGLTLSFAVGLACGGAQEKPKHSVPPVPNMNARRYAALEERAEVAITCPIPQISYSYVEGLHRMTGCGRQVDSVMYCAGGWTCIWLDSPAKDAAFATNCPVAQLQVTRIDETKYGVSGCNQRIAYVVRCHGLQCGWVSDSVTLTAPPASSSVPPVASGA